MSVRPFRAIKLNVGTQSAHRFNRADLNRQLDRLTKNFQNLHQHMNEQSPEILREALVPTFEKSKVYCPKDTGALVNSGYLETQRTRNGAQVEMGYARNGFPFYGIYVHEVPRYHAEPTRWKWLQAAIQEDAADIRQRILNLTSMAANVKAVMRMGGVR